MDSFATIVSVIYQFATNSAFLLLSAVGLIVILGMMNIINLAHGELMMMGPTRRALPGTATFPSGSA
jgi:branched-subunit amino acid ABC-type transport system permease component